MFGFGRSNQPAGTGTAGDSNNTNNNDTTNNNANNNNDLDRDKISCCQGFLIAFLVLFTTSAAAFSTTTLASCDFFVYDFKSGNVPLESFFQAAGNLSIYNIKDTIDVPTTVSDALNTTTTTTTIPPSTSTPSSSSATTTTVIYNASFGLLQWSPNFLGCTQYTDQSQLGVGFKTAQVGGIMATTTSLLALLIGFTELIFCRFVCARFFMCLSLVLGLLGQGFTFLLYASQICLHQGYTVYACQFGPSSGWSTLALISFLVASILACPAPKPKPLCKIAMERSRTQHISDPCCYCFAVKKKTDEEKEKEKEEKAKKDVQQQQQQQQLQPSDVGDVDDTNNTSKTQNNNSAPIMQANSQVPSSNNIMAAVPGSSHHDDTDYDDADEEVGNYRNINNNNKNANPYTMYNNNNNGGGGDLDDNEIYSTAHGYNNNIDETTTTPPPPIRRIHTTTAPPPPPPPPPPPNLPPLTNNTNYNTNSHWDTVPSPLTVRSVQEQYHYYVNPSLANAEILEGDLFFDSKTV